MTEATNFFYVMLSLLPLIHECTSVNSSYACPPESLLILQLRWLLLSHAQTNDLSDKLATCLPIFCVLCNIYPQTKRYDMNHSTISFVCALYYDADMCKQNTHTHIDEQNKSRFSTIFNVKLVIASTNRNFKLFPSIFRVHPQRTYL